MWLYDLKRLVESGKTKDKENDKIKKNVAVRSKAKTNTSTSVEGLSIKATANTLRCGWHQDEFLSTPVVAQSSHRSPHSRNHGHLEAPESQNSS